MFRRLFVAVLFVLAVGAASAQSADVGEKWTFGFFGGTEPSPKGSTWSYGAATAQLDWGKECVYGEFEEDYQLFIWNHSLGHGWSTVVRSDDRLFRVGVQAPLGDTGWSARFLTGALPDRLDVYTKAVEICNEAESGFKFTIDGWLMAQQGCKPDPRIGFNFSWKGVNLSAWYNTRSEEVDSVFLTAPPLSTSF